MARIAEEGSTHVLEAIVMASIMVSAVAFVVTLQPNGVVVAYESVSEAMEIRTRDFVNTRFSWPLSPGACIGATKGEQWVLDATSGRRSSFRDQVNDSFAPGIDANLVLKNGHGRMWLHREFDNPAMAAHEAPFDGGRSREL